MASKLLDFESSIEAELSAELLTGKNLNLEKARGLALEGKSVEAAAEMLKQIGGSAEFSKMNVIQQEALANAVGMTRQGLADSLIEREALAAMSGEEGETALARYNDLVKEGKTREEILDMVGEEALGQLEQQSAQDKFNASVEKLKEIFVQVMDALAPIFDMLANIATVVMPAINFILSPLIEGFSLIGDIVSYISSGIASFTGWLSKGSVAATALKVILYPIAAIAGVIAAAMIYASLSAIPIIGPALGVIAVAGMISMLAKAAMGSSKSAKKGNDIMSPGQGSSGYGKRTLFGPEGAIQLNNKDTVIAGTNLFGNDIKSEPGKITEMAKEGEIKVNSSPPKETYQDDLTNTVIPKGTYQDDPNDTIIPKGTYQDDPNDTVIMGTGIDKGKEKPTSQSPNDGSSNVKIDMTQTNTLLQRIIETNTQLINVIQTGGNVMLDGQKVGTALKLGSFKTQ
jgi:hypothetical protein